MAVPAYTEDLTDIDLAESGSTGWTAFNISGGGGGAPAFGADLGMQGAGCWDKPCSLAERGLAVNKTPGTGTVAAGVHIFQWGFCATPGITDTLANRGAYVLIGTSTANFMQFHVEGSNTYGAVGRVGKCYIVDYHTTANTGSIPYATSNGTPGATPTYFGFGLKTTATAKGSNIGADAVRYGTGAYLTAGELLSAGDGSDNPCTFAGFNTQNDNNSNRWGILTSTGGTNYEQQGRFVIGQNNAGTATLCRFRDSDKNISVVDTVHSSATFTQFIIDHASTRCEWTNINLTALGTINPGAVIVNSANPTFIVVGGTWTGIDITTMRSNTDITGLTWRNCGLVTMNSGTIDECLIDQHAGTHAVITTNPADITNTRFVSSGTGHGVRCDTTGTYSWDGNTDSGYTGARGTNLTSSTGSANAMFYNNSGGLITLNVVGGGQSPSVRNGAGATTQVNSAVPVSVSGVTRGSAVKLIARETLGAVTDGDVLAEGFADANGAFASYSHNDQGSLSISVLARNQGIATACIAEDSGAGFTDETDEGSSNLTADMTLLPATPAINDAYYFGHQDPFTRLRLDVSTALTQTATPTIVWEFWNGSAWVALTGVTDGTSGLETSGRSVVSWALPGTWAQNSVTGQLNTGNLYYVRLRLSVVGTITTTPIGRKAQLDTTRYLPYDEPRTITTGVGLTDTATWTRDLISKFDPAD